MYWIEMLLGLFYTLSKAYSRAGMHLLLMMGRVGSLGDAESQGVPSRDSSPALGDAAMCLRDPSALYLLVHQVHHPYQRHVLYVCCTIAYCPA